MFAAPDWGPEQADDERDTGHIRIVRGMCMCGCLLFAACCEDATGAWGDTVRYCTCGHTEADHELCSLDLRSGILTSLLSHPDDMLYVEEGEEEGEGWEDPNVPAAVGRPRTVINLQYVIQLRSEGFIWKHIRMLLGDIPKTTFNRWRLDQRFEEHDPLVQVNDDELVGLIAEFLVDQPERGYGSVQSFLASLGVRCSRQRVRDAVRSFDPAAVEKRRKGSIPRVQYNIKHWMHLWHNDGNHKLKAWGIVLQGGIDGGSCGWLPSSPRHLPSALPLPLLVSLPPTLFLGTLPLQLPRLSPPLPLPQLLPMPPPLRPRGSMSLYLESTEDHS